MLSSWFIQVGMMSRIAWSVSWCGRLKICSKWCMAALVMLSLPYTHPPLWFLILCSCGLLLLSLIMLWKYWVLLSPSSAHLICAFCNSVCWISNHASRIFCLTLEKIFSTLVVVVSQVQFFQFQHFSFPFTYMLIHIPNNFSGPQSKFHAQNLEFLL